MKNKKEADLDKLISILSIFAAHLNMAVAEFSDRMAELQTGTREVRGNEGVTLGTVNTRRK